MNSSAYSFPNVRIFSLIALLTFSLSMSFVNVNDWWERLKANYQQLTSELPADAIYLHTDKTLYKPGETIWLEAYVRNASDLKPSAQSEILHLEWISPKGTVEKELHLIVRDGKASGDLALGEEMAGGIYTLKAHTQWQKNEQAPFYFEKKITVQKVVLPMVKMTLDFEKDAYGKGAAVQATFEAKDRKDQPVNNSNVEFLVKVKGTKTLSGEAKTNAEGEALLEFALPKNLHSADVLLTVKLPQGNRTESISRAVPVALQNISLQFLPEGGQWLAGFNGNLAFKATNEFGKPADVSGTIKDENGYQVARFESLHKGMGAVRFKPETGKKYTAHITEPKGSANPVVLPSPLPRGFAMNIQATTPKELLVEVQSSEKEELTVIGKIREQIVYQQSITVNRGAQKLTANTTRWPMGVVQFTLFDSKGIERAERLVYANHQQHMNIEITADKKAYAPREEVTLNIRTTDYRGIPLPANFSMAVVDDQNLTFADDKQGRILSKLLLEPYLVGKIEEPSFYFDPKEEKATQALDYVMLTHGWRKFSWEEISKKQNNIPQYPAEKALVSGKVMKAGKPVEGATITVDSAQMAITNAQGEFEITTLDLYRPTVLTAQKGKDSATYTLADYSEKPTIYLDRRFFVQQARRMKMGNDAWGDGGDDWGEEAPEMAMMAMAEAVEEKAIGMELDVEIDKKTVVEAIVEQEKQVIAEKKVVEVADEEEIEELNEFIPNQAIRIGVLPNQAEKESRYYRARVFPKMDYAGKKAPEKRTDFRSTIYWKGNIETGKDGLAHVKFFTSDAITSFRAVAEGIGVDGTPGKGETVIFAQLPLSLSAKVPVEASFGDQLELPVFLNNETGKTLKGELNISLPKSLKATSKLPKNVTLPRGETVLYLPLEVLNQPGQQTLELAFSAGNYKDAFEQEINIVAKGFPVAVAYSGNEPSGTFNFEISQVVPGTLSANLTAYPTIMGELLEGIESILREPYGCFEQTSSSTYPNIMVLDYLQENDIDNPAIVAKAKALIDQGYKRLVSFETEENGYEWFGGTPAHEALSAYGLMEFHDMSEVYASVDTKMVTRTADWLLSRKDGTGGFKRSKQALDSFGGASEEITNAYIVYALSEAGYIQHIKKELDRAYENAQASHDPYQMGLVANALFNVNDRRAEPFLASFNPLQSEDGSWNGKTHSITRSTGKGLKVETTSLALMANFKSTQPGTQSVNEGVKYMMAARSPHGGFGNTQSTVMALKALTAFAKFARQAGEDGSLSLTLNGASAQTLSYAKGEEGPLALNGLESQLKTGKNQMQLNFAKSVKNPLPYTFAVEYSSFQPLSSDSCAVDLLVKLKTNKVNVGETVRMQVQLSNTSAQEGQPMTLAEVGIPGGLSAQPWQLKELMEKKVIDFYEIRDNRLALYYRDLAPNAKKEINLDLKAEIPGEYTGTASSAYLYYTNERKVWQEGVKVRVSK